MVEESVLQVSYIIDGILTVIPTKVICELSDENELQKVHYEVIWKNNTIISKACSDTEFAIVKLQEVLPPNISIACCQSCRHGNFCPFGDCDNEIFCFKDMTPNDKSDVCEFFLGNQDSLGVRSRKLLGFCKDYKPICPNEYYTYNDWGYRKTNHL
jgi:hypothetical protein